MGLALLADRPALAQISNITKMVADNQRPYIYAVQPTAANGQSGGQLLFINTETENIEAVLPIGDNPTDLTIHYAENRLYIANYGRDETYVVDLNNRVLLPSLHLGTDVYKINAAQPGRIFREGFDQWIAISIIDTATGATVGALPWSQRQGDGEASMDGTAYYHCDDNISNAHIHKYNLTNDVATEVASSLQHPYGSRNLVVTPDGSRLFWRGYMYDTGLNELCNLGSEIYATSLHGDIAFSSTQVFNTRNGKVLYTLPINSSVIAVAGNQRKVFLYDSSQQRLRSIPMSQIADIPGPDMTPGVADGNIVGLPLQQLNWSANPFALSYQVYFGTNAAEVTAATTNSPAYRGTVTTPSYPLDTALQYGSTYFWRVDSVWYGSVTTGTVWRFTTAPFTVAPVNLSLKGVVGLPLAPQAVDITVSSGIVWNVATSAPWISATPASGNAAGTLSVAFNMTGFTNGIYTNNLLITSGGVTLGVPVVVELFTLVPSRMVSDPNRPYIYVLHRGSGNFEDAYLLFLNTASNVVEKVLPMGCNPTDLTLNRFDNLLFISNWHHPNTHVVDLVTKTERPSLQLGTDVYKINAGSSGRLLCEGYDQWIAISIIDTATGTAVGALPYPQRQGDGEFSPDGRVYYHCDDNISNAHIHKYNLTNDVATEVASSLQHPYGSRHLLLSPDGARLFWRGYVYDGALNELGSLGSEIYTCTTNGGVAIGDHQVFETATHQVIYNLPFTNSVTAVDGVNQSLWYFDPNTVRFKTISITNICTPKITQQPPALTTVKSGGNINLTVSAIGSSALAFQWFFNGVRQAGSTNSFLAMSNMTTNQSGNYKVAVSNQFGSLTSVTATVVVLVAPEVLPASGVTVNSFNANWSPMAGATNYLLDISASSNFTNCVAGYSNLSVGAVTTWRVSNLNAGSIYYYRVRQMQVGLASDNSATVQAVTVIASLSATNGPWGGGNTITISGAGLGSGTDITNVTICGISAAIQSQTANSVTVLVGASGSGTGNIKVYSIGSKVTTLPGAYTYNPQGLIFSAFFNWAGLSNLPEAVSTHAAASVSNLLYSFGGGSSAYGLDILNPVASWSSVSNLPTGRPYLAGVAISNRLYAIGGNFTNMVSVMDTLNPSAGWGSVSNLPGVRNYPAAAVVGGKIYVAGGSDGSGQFKSTAWVYDPAQPAQGWLSISNLPSARRGHAMEAVGGKLYVVGGENSSQVAQSNAWVYDPAQPTLGWLSISNLPAPRAQAILSSLNERLFAICGRDNSTGTYQTATAFMFDTLNPTQGWQSVGSGPLPLNAAAGTTANGSVYVIGGTVGTGNVANVFVGSLAEGVAPQSGVQAGGNLVTINGRDLGSHDVTNVTLCGIEATIVTDNSPTQIVVNSGAALTPGTGDVVVYSASCGKTTGTKLFAYNVNLAVEASPANGGSVSGGGNYPAGTNVQITATSSNSWIFLGWNDGITNSVRTIVTPSTNITYTANFALVANISVQASNNIGGSVTGGGAYVVGSNDVLMATPSNGWHFIQWSDGVTNNPRTIVVASGGASYTAIFAPVADITVLANPASSGSVSGGGTYVVGSNVILTATATYGWLFTQWNDGSLQNPRTITVPDGGGSYTATFVSVARLVQIQDTNTAAGALLTLPVILVAQSNENALGFSLVYDNTILTYSNIMVGSNALTATIMQNTNQLSNGRLGVALALPSGATFDPGTQQIALVSFRAALLSSTTSTVVGIGEQPIPRQLVDNSAGSIPCLWSKGNISISGGVGYEGDVTDRPNGNSSVSIADWVQVGRFAAGLDTPNNISEFQRSDCAPRIFLGDGVISIIDWVQAGRYAVNLDPITLMGGPTSPDESLPMQSDSMPPEDGVNLLMMPSEIAGLSTPPAVASLSNSVLTIHSIALQIGQTNGVLVDMQAQGSENALGFSVDFDPLLLNFVQAQPDGGAGSATVLLNTNQVGSGRVGIGLALSPGQTFAAGSNALITLYFTGAASGTTSVHFADAPVVREVVDASAHTLNSIYSNGVVFVTEQKAVLNVKANPASGGSVSGGGTYLSGSNVTLTATTAPGWVFLRWDDGNTNMTRTIIVPFNNFTYTAIFTMGLGAALNATNLVWTTGGNANWYVQTTTTRDGAAAHSGAISAGQTSFFQTTTNGPGSVLFWWKASTAAANQLQFYVGTQLVSQVSGNAGWSQVATFIGSTNPVTLTWVYAKNSAAVAGADAGYVDQITWLPCSWATNVPQLFFQEPNGLIASWVLNTTGGFEFARVLANTGSWGLKAAGDMDGDSVSDLLFQSPAGDTGGWFLNADGSTREARFWFNTSGWEIKAAGDYEGLGRGQLFFQTAAGLAAYWRLDTNGAFQAAVGLGSMGPWKLRSVGDLDGDLKAELFWQNALGVVAIWWHNPDGSIRGTVPFGTGEWALCGVADVDLDGVCDLIWQTPDTRTGGWFMNSNGTARAASFWWPTGGWKLKAAGR
jgi:N-acetylneuraminic acid mutarotase